jgi:hypothetical protein
MVPLSVGRAAVYIPPFAKCCEGWGTRAFAVGLRVEGGAPARFRMVRLYEPFEPHGDSNQLYGGTKMKSNMSDDLEDIPMAYFWYPFLAIVAMVVGAVAVVLKMV